MYWILAAIFLLVTLMVPRLRPLSVVGCVILGVMLAWGVAQRLRGTDPTQAQNVQERGKPSSPATVFDAIPLEQVSVEQLQMSGSGAPFELRGRVTNNSPDMQLRSITIRVTRRDCYEGAVDPSGCGVLWQDRHWLSLSVPPQETRDFVTSVWMHGSAGRPRGTAQDNFEIIVAAGEAAKPTRTEKVEAERVQE